MPKLPTVPITPCRKDESTRLAIERYAEQLKQASPSIGDHGMTPEEFWSSGLFRSAVERIRGQQSASMTEKRGFIPVILDHLTKREAIRGWESSESHDRHDYEVRLRSGKLAVIEAKGCLDGNNTNILSVRHMPTSS